MDARGPERDQISSPPRTGPPTPHYASLLFAKQSCNPDVASWTSVPSQNLLPRSPVLAQISCFEGTASFCLQTAASMDFLTCVPNPWYETIVAQSVASSATVKQSVHANTLGGSAACNFKIVMQMLLLLKKMQRTGQSVRRAPVAAW